MNKIQDYLDYRQFLKDQLNEIREKKACYSYRRIAQKLNIDPGQLVKILQGERHISKRLIPVFASFLCLKEQELEYFILLVYFNKEKDSNKKLSYLEKFKKLNHSSDNAVINSIS